MQVHVRLWCIDHWTDWAPADPSTLRSLSPSDRQDLLQGDTLSRFGNLQQITSDPATVDADDPTPTETTYPVSKPVPSLNPKP